MDDRIERSLALIEEWHCNRNPSGRNDIDTLYALKEILEEEPSGEMIRPSDEDLLKIRDEHERGKDWHVVKVRMDLPESSIVGSFGTSEEAERFQSESDALDSGSGKYFDIVHAGDYLNLQGSRREAEPEPGM